MTRLDGWKEAALLAAYISLYSAGGLLTKLSKGDDGYGYNPVGVTLVVGCVKLVLSVGMLLRGGWDWDVKWKETWRFAYPAVVYLIDDNLQFAVLHFITPGEAALFFSFKVLTTALTSQLMLARPISSVQWSSLTVLALGLATSKTGGQHFQGFNAGHVLVSIVCVIGSTGDVYNEKLLKGSVTTSIHLQNAKLYVFSILFNGAGYILYDLHPPKGTVYTGWTPYVYPLIAANALNGIAVSVIFKFLDNIIKVQAAAAAMVLTVVLSSLIFGREPALGFYLGVGIVFNSLFIFNHKMVKVAPPSEDGVALNTDTASDV